MIDEVAIKLKCAEIAHVSSARLDIESGKKLDFAKKIYDFVTGKTHNEPLSQGKNTGG